MNRTQRAEYLNNLLDNATPVGSMNVAYKSPKVEAHNVYRIDLNYLVYNQYNGRIGTLVKAHEVENGPIDAENQEHRKLIERFLWDSQPERNTRTMENLETVGQRDPGIVTLDGVIIDGNRRASLLVENARKKKEPIAYFNAVILPDPMGEDNAREIKRLETQYQMGLDEKLGYNALEKYLQIQDLHDNGFEIPGEVAKLMNYDEIDIEKFWEVKQLMDLYLKRLGYENMYTRLDRAEDWFWKLQESLKRFDPDRGAGASDQVQWTYTKADVNDLQNIMFDYIRASREAGADLLGSGQAYRDICSASKTGFFKHKYIWENFRDTHYQDFDEITEQSIEEHRAANPDLSITEVLKRRDKDYTDSVKDLVKKNFNQTRGRVSTENDKNEPKILLEAALSKLQAVDEESSVFRNMCANDGAIKDILVAIGRKQTRLKRVSEKIESPD